MNSWEWLTVGHKTSAGSIWATGHAYISYIMIYDYILLEHIAYLFWKTTLVQNGGRTAPTQFETCLPMPTHVYANVCRFRCKHLHTHTYIYIYIFDIYTYRSSSGGSLGSSSQSKHPTNQIPLHSPQSLRQRCQRCFPPRCKAVSPQDDRRKFRSQTSDNMDRWKAEMGRVREEKRRRKKIKKEKVSEERRSRWAKG